MSAWASGASIQSYEMNLPGTLLSGFRVEHNLILSALGPTREASLLTIWRHFNEKSKGHQLISSTKMAGPKSAFVTTRLYRMNMKQNPG
jgi:hypothetical protein